MRLTSCSVILVGALLTYGCTRQSPPSPRDEWKEKAVACLGSFSLSVAAPPGETNTMEMRFGTWASYGVPGNIGTGLLSFGESQWLYLLSHSEHLPDGIGDISVAADQDGRLYQLDAHVCGGILFVDTNSSEFAQSTEDFMARFVPWPDSSKTWQTMEESPTSR